LIRNEINNNEDLSSYKNLSLFFNAITKEQYDKSNTNENIVKNLKDTIVLDSLNIVFGDFKGVSYHCEYYIPKIKSYLISFESEESYGYYLLNTTNMQVQYINNEPCFSPNGNLFVTKRNDGDPDIMATLSLYSRDGKKIKSSDELNLQIENIYWINDDELYIKGIIDNDVEKYYMLNIDNFIKGKNPVKISSIWLGKFSVTVTEESIAIITYNFSITEESVNLETITYHAPIRCNGKYLAKTDNNILILNYIGNGENCENAEFEIKIEDSEYYIKGVGGLETSDEWIKLEKQQD